MPAHRIMIALSALLLLLQAPPTEPRTVELTGVLGYSNGTLLIDCPVSVLETPFPATPNETTRRLADTKTGAKGEFRFEFLATFDKKERALHSFAIVTRSHSALNWQRMQLEADRDLVEGRHDLGACILTQSELLASGVVVDDLGNQVPNSEVHVVWPVKMGDAREPLAWLPDPNLATSGSEFSLFGPAAAWEYDLQAFAKDHLPSMPVHAKLGTRGLRFELTRFGWVEAGVRLPDEIPIVVQEFMVIRLFLTRLGSSSGRFLSGLAEKGIVHIPNVEPGRWTLTAELPIAQGLALGDVDVHAARMADLGTIDLRERLRVLHLDVVLGPGMSQPVTIDTEPSWIPQLYSNAENRALFVMAATTATARWKQSWIENVMVLSEGSRAQWLGRLDSDRRVVLEAGIPVTMKLPDGLAMPRGPWKLASALDPFASKEKKGWNSREYGDLFTWSAFHAIDSRHEAHYRLPVAGECRVRWLLFAGDERVRLGATTVQVEDQTEPQTIEIAPDPNEYAAALAKISAR